MKKTNQNISWWVHVWRPSLRPYGRYHTIPLIPGRRLLGTPSHLVAGVPGITGVACNNSQRWIETYHIFWCKVNPFQYTPPPVNAPCFSCPFCVIADPRLNFWQDKSTLYMACPHLIFRLRNFCEHFRCHGSKCIRTSQGNVHWKEIDVISRNLDYLSTVGEFRSGVTGFAKICATGSQRFLVQAHTESLPRKNNYSNLSKWREQDLLIFDIHVHIDYRSTRFLHIMWQNTILIRAQELFHRDSFWWSLHLFKRRLFHIQCYRFMLTMFYVPGSLQRRHGILHMKRMNLERICCVYAWKTFRHRMKIAWHKYSLFWEMWQHSKSAQQIHYPYTYTCLFYVGSLHSEIRWEKMTNSAFQAHWGIMELLGVLF